MHGATIAKGPIFRRIRVGDQVGQNALSDRSVRLIVKRHAERIGLDPTTVSGDSLRSGGIAVAARRGYNERELARLARVSDPRLMRGYEGPATPFNETAQVLTDPTRDDLPDPA